MNKILRNIQKILKDNDLEKYCTKKYLDYGISAFAVLLGFYLKWDIENIAMFTFVIWIILNPVSSQLLARISLVLLFFTPLLLFIGRNTQAEQMATFAFYFLSLTVIAAIIENKSENLLKQMKKKK